MRRRRRKRGKGRNRVERATVRPRGGTRGALACAPLAAAALTVALASSLPAQAVPVDTAALGTGPYARMHMLYERTIFQVDVLRLEVRLGTDAAARIEDLIAPRDGADPALDDAALRDSIAALALQARDVLVRQTFKRDVSLERFLAGIRKNLRAATRAGILDPSDYERISENLPRWYDVLADRGLRSGDRMFQRVSGDTLHTVYVAAAGRTLLDQVDVGPERRLAVLGGYFAPGSEFREGLIDSVPEGP